MKKLFLSLVVLFSFLIGNVSMIVTVVKIFGSDALMPVVKDLVGRKVDAILWGAPQTPRERLGQTAYGSITRERRDQLISDMSGPILRPTPGDGMGCQRVQH